MKVWREGGRIRAEDGSGYGDRVSDTTLWERIEAARVRRAPDDAAAIEFAEAVLRYRAAEREAGHSSVGDLLRRNGGRL